MAHHVLRLSKHSKILNSSIGFGTKYSTRSEILNIHTALINSDTVYKL